MCDLASIMLVIITCLKGQSLKLSNNHMLYKLNMACLDWCMCNCIPFLPKPPVFLP